MNTLLIKVGAVSDSSLPKFDALRIGILPYTGSGASRVIDFWENTSVSLTLNGTGHFTTQDGSEDRGQTIQNTGRYVFVSTDATGYIDIISKQSINAFNSGSNFSANISEFEYTPATRVQFTSPGLYGSIDDTPLLCSRLTNFVASTDSNFTGITGNIANFGNLLQVLQVKNTNLYGDLAELGKAVGLTYLEIQGCTKLQGTLDDLANALYSNGKVSGTLNAYDVDSTHVVYTFTSEGWTKV